MKKVTTLLLFAFVMVKTYAQEKSCQLIIKVENIRNVQGKMKFGIYDHQDRFLKTAVTWGDEAIVSDTVVFTFNDLIKGTYAVSIFQDVNDNGKLDANFMGMPTEPYAFSNNARGLFGPPSFESCKFDLSGDKQEIVISL